MSQQLKAYRTSTKAVPTLSASTSRLITSSKPFHPPRYLPPCVSDLAFADTERVYQFHLLIYLLTKLTGEVTP